MAGKDFHGLSPQASRIYNRMMVHEGNFISASEARGYRDAVDELMDLGLVTYGTYHNSDGVVLANKAVVGVRRVCNSVR